MQQLDALTLHALGREFSRLLDNAKVSKVQHPSAHEFLLTFWGGASRADQRNLFYIHLSPEAPFCVLTDKPHYQAVAQTKFSKPTALCMLLRKHLNGANLLDVKTLPSERVLNLYFENFNELGNKVQLVLSLELMGKHTNMILYDAIQEVILAVAHGVSERMSSHRELAAGLPYAPPPKPPGKRRLCELTTQEFKQLLAQKPSEETDEQYLNRQLAGFGRQILSEALQITSEPVALYALLSALEEGKGIVPAISRDHKHFTLIPANKPCQMTKIEWEPVTSANELVERYFMRALMRIRLARAKQQLLGILDQQEKKRSRREAELIPMSQEEIETLRACGDRLLAAVSAGEIPDRTMPDQSKITLNRYETGEPWEIEIDPSCSWVENAQIYYRRVKKAKTRRALHQQMAEQLGHEREYIENLRQLVLQAESLSDLQVLEDDLAQAGFCKPSNSIDIAASRKKPDLPAGVLSLRSSDGFEILLGKSGQGNEAIVGKLARPDDWWLHVHQMPGSHVLVRTGRAPLSDQALLEAAHLAAWYSSARESLNVPVVYTQSRYVRKIPQSYPGHVNYREERTVFITPEITLIEKLLKLA